MLNLGAPRGRPVYESNAARRLRRRRPARASAARDGCAGSGARGRGAPASRGPARHRQRGTRTAVGAVAAAPPAYLAGTWHRARRAPARTDAGDQRSSLRSWASDRMRSVRESCRRSGVAVDGGASDGPDRRKQTDPNLCHQRSRSERETACWGDSSKTRSERGARSTRHQVGVLHAEEERRAPPRPSVTSLRPSTVVCWRARCVG
jgi:hypothetical protein